MEFVALGAVAGLVIVLLVAVRLIRRRRTVQRPVPGPEQPGSPGQGAAIKPRLEQTRRALAGKWSVLAAKSPVDDAFWVEMEDLLLSADVGVGVAGELIKIARGSNPTSFEAARSELQAALVDLFGDRRRDLDLVGGPAVILVVGVNGAGKTTTIAKLAHLLGAGGRTVLLGGADTFRAAADVQLRTWGDRLGIDVVLGQPGADAAAVAFDAYEAARARGADTVIVDTAGRLQSKANLMAELGKVGRVLERAAGRIDEVLLVLDGTTGQNAIGQARVFAEAVAVTGIVVTKLDGTARGGVALAIERDFDIPLKFVGVGEAMEDLIRFDAATFVEALLGQ